MSSDIDAQFSIFNHDDNHQRNALRFNNNSIDNPRQRRRQWRRQRFRKLFKNVEHVCILFRFKLNRNSNTFNIDVNVRKLQFRFPCPKLSSLSFVCCLDRIFFGGCVVTDYIRASIVRSEKSKSISTVDVSWKWFDVIGLGSCSTPLPTPPARRRFPQSKIVRCRIVVCMCPPSITAHFLT